MEKIVARLLEAKVIPPPSHLSRTCRTLPSLLMKQAAHGTGLEVEETSCPRWAGKSLVISRVQPEFVMDWYSIGITILRDR